jgi:hypothetical protein
MYIFMSLYLNMNIMKKRLILFFLLALSHITYASGQRSTFVTFESIASYISLKPGEHTPSEPVLHYIGSVGDEKHLLMKTATVLPQKIEVRPGVFEHRGRPWDHVETYYIDADSIRITNGWDITELLNKGGFSVTPTNCPALRLDEGVTQHTIPDKLGTKEACTGTQTPQFVWE